MAIAAEGGDGEAGEGAVKVRPSHRDRERAGEAQRGRRCRGQRRRRQRGGEAAEKVRALRRGLDGRDGRAAATRGVAAAAEVSDCAAVAESTSQTAAAEGARLQSSARPPPSAAVTGLRHRSPTPRRQPTRSHARPAGPASVSPSLVAETAPPAPLIGAPGANTDASAPFDAATTPRLRRPRWPRRLLTPADTAPRAARLHAHSAYGPRPSAQRPHCVPLPVTRRRRAREDARAPLDGPPSAPTPLVLADAAPPTVLLAPPMGAPKRSRPTPGAGRASGAALCARFARLAVRFHLRRISACPPPLCSVTCPRS